MNEDEVAARLKYKSVLDKLTDAGVYLMGNSEQINVEKLKFLGEEMSLTETELFRLIKHYPRILGLYIKGIEGENISSKQRSIYLANKTLSLQERFVSIRKKLNLDETEFRKLFRTFPQIVGFNDHSLDKKLENIAKEFDIHDEGELKAFVVASPTLLGLASRTFNQKIGYYQELFDYSREQILPLLKLNPKMFTYKMEGTMTASKTKLQKLLELGASIEQIISNPVLLSIPAQKAKIRYLIMAQSMEDKEIFGSKNLMTNEKKLYARHKYLENSNSKSYLCISEPQFQLHAQADSYELMEMYPLTLEAVCELESQYYITHNKLLTLNDAEKQALFDTTIIYPTSDSTGEAEQEIDMGE